MLFSLGHEMSLPQSLHDLALLVRSLDSGPAMRVFLQATFATLVLLTATAWLSRWRAAETSRRSLTLLETGGLLLTLFALALRLALSPRAFLHEGYWATWSYDYIFHHGGGMYGSTGPALFQVVHSLFGGMERAIFFGNVVLAALTAPAVLALSWMVFRNSAAALLAGFIASVLPIHLRYSASEELWIPGTLFAVWSLAAAIDWIESERSSSLAIAALALTLAAHSRPEFLMLPAAHLGLLLVVDSTCPWRERILRPDVLLWLFVVAPILIARAVGGSSSNYTFNGFLPLSLFWESWIGSRPEITPMVLLPMLALGIVYGAWRTPRRTVWLLAVAFLFIELPLSVFRNDATMLRTSLLSMMLVTVVASSAPLLLAVPRATARALPLAAMALALVFAVGAWRNHGFVSAQTDEELEHAFLEEILPLLPPVAQIIALHAPGHSAPPDWFDPFPRFLIERSPSKLQFHQLPDVGVSVPWPEPAPNLFFYQGMACHFSSVLNVVPTAPLRERCLEIRDHYEMQPLRVVNIVAQRREHGTLYPGPDGPFELGLFQITGVRG